MKISIAWVFDHINADWRSINIHNLVKQFNEKTAEIERYEKIQLDVTSFELAQCVSFDHHRVTMKLSKTNTEITVALRKDLFLHGWYVLKNNGNTYCWATMKDVGSEKESMLPSIHMDEISAQQAVEQLELSDYILHIDNKSVTHRPDLWGHRGIAREIALLFHYELKPLDVFLHHHFVQSENQLTVCETQNCSLQIETPLCNRLSALMLPTVSSPSSFLDMAVRLSSIDTRPINFLVDCTNYVMHDIGHPMHVFDADKLAQKKLVVRLARDNETVVTLDADTLTLTKHDLVITDGISVLSLAGIMGGIATAVDATTHSIIIEAAQFDPGTVRKSSLHHKKRTEASSRFEKGLDPNQTVVALGRFIKLLDDAGIQYSTEKTIVSVGQSVEPKLISITHAYIEQLLGTSIDATFIVTTLTKLGCTVVNEQAVYQVTVPTYRSYKDMQNQEDIVEEIGRLYGYGEITPIMPSLPSQPGNTQKIVRLRAIKEFLSYGVNMNELNNYAFFDEDFLSVINWQPLRSISVKNPVSTNWYRLVTSLIPNLLKAIHDNSVDHTQMRFFEQARVWSYHNDTVIEQQKIAGIFFDQHALFNFYQGKAFLEQLFSFLGISVHWERMETVEFPWQMVYQSALLMHQNTTIGTAGMVPEPFLQQIFSPSTASAFIFELDTEFLSSSFLDATKFFTPSKFPAVHRDISLFIPIACTVQTVITMIQNTDSRITNVTLIDFFEKKEWDKKRATTFRFTVSDYHKTLLKEEIDTIVEMIIQKLVSLGASVR